MKKLIIILFLFLPFITYSQQDSLSYKRFQNQYFTGTCMIMVGGSIATFGNYQFQDTRTQRNLIITGGLLSVTGYLLVRKSYSNLYVSPCGVNYLF
jgi:hypothetical protein